MFYYIGTVIFHMSPARFWRCTPRKFHALCEVHADLNSPKESNRNKNSSQGATKTIGQPDTYIDEIM